MHRERERGKRERERGHTCQTCCRHYTDILPALSPNERERERERESAFESDLQQTAHIDIPDQLPASTRCQGTSGGRSGFEHVTAPLGTGYRRSLQSQVIQLSVTQSSENIHLLQ